MHGMLTAVMLRVLAVAALLVLLVLPACRKDPVVPPAPPVTPAEVQLEGAYHAVACGPVTAVWSGNGAALADLPQPAPKTFGVESLAFRFADGTSKGFTTQGQLFFNDWRFDIFSPDCRFVALLTDHAGPYHVVKTAELRGYLEHTVAPLVLGPTDLPTASVFADLRWLDATHVVFTTSCCGGGKALEGDVTTGKTTVVLDAPEAPKGLRPAGRSFEVVK